MEDNSPEIDIVEEDTEHSGSTGSSGSPKQIRVDMTFGVAEFTPDRDDCVQCRANMDKVVVVDKGPLSGTELNREAIPVCINHVDEVVQVNEQEGHEVKVLE